MAWRNWWSLWRRRGGSASTPAVELVWGGTALAWGTVDLSWGT